MEATGIQRRLERSILAVARPAMLKAMHLGMVTLLQKAHRATTAAAPGAPCCPRASKLQDKSALFYTASVWAHRRRNKPNCLWSRHLPPTRR